MPERLLEYGVLIGVCIIMAGLFNYVFGFIDGWKQGRRLVREMQLRCHPVTVHIPPFTIDPAKPVEEVRLDLDEHFDLFAPDMPAQEREAMMDELTHTAYPMAVERQFMEDLAEVTPEDFRD